MAALDFMALFKEEREKENNRKRRTKAVQEPNEIPPEELFFEKLELPPRPHIDLISFAVRPVNMISYIPLFVTTSESRAILDNFFSVPAHHPRWVKLKGRSLQCWGGQPGIGGSNSTFVPESLPQWLQIVCSRLVECNVFPAETPPNHVLVNSYMRGEGIMPHTDGPAYAPRTATLSLSLESDDNAEDERTHGVVVTFENRVRTEEVGLLHKTPPQCELVLRPRSLIVFSDDAYINYMHAIEDLSRRSGVQNVDGVVDGHAGDQMATHGSATSGAAPLVGKKEDHRGMFDIAGTCAEVANNEAALVHPGESVFRPGVRVSLTFRHIL